MIRRLRPFEKPYLEVFLYEAIFIPEGEAPPPPSIIYHENLYRHIEDFDESKGDLALLYEQDGEIVALAWARDKEGLYGHLEEGVPVISMSVLNGFRNQGIGTHLLKALLEALKKEAIRKPLFQYKGKMMLFIFMSALVLKP